LQNWGCVVELIGEKAYMEGTMKPSVFTEAEVDEFKFKVEPCPPGLLTGLKKLPKLVDDEGNPVRLQLRKPASKSGLDRSKLVKAIKEVARQRA